MSDPVLSNLVQTTPGEPSSIAAASTLEPDNDATSIDPRTLSGMRGFLQHAVNDRRYRGLDPEVFMQTLRTKSATKLGGLLRIFAVTPVINERHRPPSRTGFRIHFGVMPKCGDDANRRCEFTDEEDFLFNDDPPRFGPPL